MVILVIPIFCEISARWLGSGRSSTNDCAGLTADMAAISRQKQNPCKAALIMWKRLLLQLSNFWLKRAADRRPTLVEHLRRSRGVAVSRSLGWLSNCDYGH